MQYTLNRSNYRNFDTIQVNKLDGRAYFIPYSNADALQNTDACTERFGSDKVQVLSGAWQFKYYDSLQLLPTDFDTERVSFDDITVPSTWQRTGYYPPIYLNSRYEFHLMPPELPKDMAVGVYRKSFTVTDADKRYILSFLGVAPCIDVYLNGKVIGYSEGSHNTAEFDITNAVTVGENELLCVVHRYSTGTFLECQDMFRETGIFRDVLLFTLDKTDILDYEIKSERTAEGKYDLTLQTTVFGNTDGCSLCAALYDGDTLLAESTADAAGKTELQLSNLAVTEWNAEVPTVYDLLITLQKNGETVSVVRNVTGFKRIVIDRDVFKFNDKPIKIKGVNHHDSHHENGYVMSAQDIQKDLTLMKQFNVNTVRTSHYPPDPILLTLADQMGIYVVDEADIETHGTGSIGPHKLYKPNLLSHSDQWKERYVDRVQRMYLRDRNHPSVTMWSLGNESGGYKNQDACCAYLKKVCPEIPVHYEGVIRTQRVAYDVVSEMYTEIADVLKVRDGTRGDKYKGKPFYLCEYAHAMGVGPGSLEDYWQAFYSNDKLMGGCIWEFCDHAVHHKKDEKGYKYEYTYGGDHGEEMHDGNFCVDGLFYPDRTPHTGALEMKEVYRPLRAVKMDAQTYKFINTNRFRSSDYIEIHWVLLEDGAKVGHGSFSLDIAPQAEELYTIPAVCTDKEKDYLLNITYTDKESGEEIAHEQFILNDVAPALPIDKRKKIVLNTQDKKFILSSPDCTVVFDKTNGAMESYKAFGKERLNVLPAGGIAGFVPNIYRAPIDNDSYAWAPKWDRKKLPLVNPAFLGIAAKEVNDHIAVKVKYKLAKGLATWYICTLDYAVYPDGTVKVDALLERKFFGAKDLPRFGVTVELPKAVSYVEYYGRGPAENMCDFNAQSPVGVYRSTVRNMHENYIKPQDNGNHGGTKRLRLFDSDGDGLEFIGVPKFSFSVHEYTQNLLCEAKHREDLRAQNTTFLSLDGFMRGAGSNACGPDALEKYRFAFKDELKFRFAVKPLDGAGK